jgi:hypothetical protein
MSTYQFTAEDADIVLRASRSDVPREFRLHKMILSFTSPVFKGMFDIPQPISSTTPTRPDIPVIDVDDTPEDLEIFLRMIYPFGFPQMPTLDAIIHALGMLDKYEVQGGPLQTLRTLLVSQKFLENEPIMVYSIACHWKFKEEASLAAPYTSSLDIVSLAKTEDVHRMTSMEYHHILLLGRERRSKCEAYIDRAFVPVCCDNGFCKEFYSRFRSNLLDEFKRKHRAFYDLGWCIARCFEMAIEARGWSLQSKCGGANNPKLGSFISTLAAKLNERP